MRSENDLMTNLFPSLKKKYMYIMRIFMKNLWGVYIVSWILVLHINKKILSLSRGLSFFIWKWCVLFLFLNWRHLWLTRSKRLKKRTKKNSGKIVSFRVKACSQSSSQLAMNQEAFFKSTLEYGFVSTL